MKKVLKNAQIELTVDSFGAEMHSILHENTEYLWQADGEFWARHAPVLFPIVGKLKGGQYTYEGQTYKMGGHGFARDNEFELVEASDEKLIFEMKSSAETLAHYPFAFNFRVIYELNENKIKVRYEVVNEDEKMMKFGVGAHPAFNVPLMKGSFSDYKLTISPSEKRTFVPLDPPSGTLKVAEKQVVEVSELPLTRELFKEDALVYTSSEAMSVSLTNSLDTQGVTVSWQGMPYFGLWSPYPKEAPFVCIEPWCGLADDAATDGDLATKFGINSLPAGQKFACEYEIEIK